MAILVFVVFVSQVLPTRVTGSSFKLALITFPCGHIPLSKHFLTSRSQENGTDSSYIFPSSLWNPTVL